MRKFCIPVIAAVSLFALPALAATGPTKDSITTTPPDTTQIEQQLQQDLSKAGYTGIKIVPGSFLVQAKDKQGNQTEMMISPHSMTEVTAMSASDSSTKTGKSEKSESVSPTTPTSK
jgi:Peptidase propeptide and YPEB domain